MSDFFAALLSLLAIACGLLLNLCLHLLSAVGLLALGVPGAVCALPCAIFCVIRKAFTNARTHRSKR